MGAFDSLNSFGVPAYTEGNASNPSGYGNSNPMRHFNKQALVVGLIVIGAILLLIMGVVGLRVSGEVVI